MKPKLRKFLSVILKLPLALIVLASFFAGIYAAYFKIQDIGWESPIIIGLCIVLYIAGGYMSKGGQNENK